MKNWKKKKTKKHPSISHHRLWAVFCKHFLENWPCYDKTISYIRMVHTVCNSLNINVCTVTMASLPVVIGIGIGMTNIIFYHCSNICSSNPYMCQQSVGQKHPHILRILLQYNNHMFRYKESNCKDNIVNGKMNLAPISMIRGDFLLETWLHFHCT